MISSLRGKLEAVGGGWAIVNLHGIGFRVHVPNSTLSTLGPVGTEVRLHTHLHVRDDGLTLYGFESDEQLALFQALMTVSGIGPKLALAMLSSLTVEQLTMAIATGSVELLTMVPGVGKKTASRVVLELKDKVGALWAVTPAARLGQENTDVLAALTVLGYSPSEAARAVAALPSTELTLEEKIRLALQFFSKK